MINKKMIIGIVVTICLSVGTAFATTIFVKEDKPVDLKALATAYQTEMETQLKNQKEKLETQYEKEHKEKDKEEENTVEFMCSNLANLIGKYYTENTSEINVTKNIALDNFVISFPNEKRNEIIDNEKDIENIYEINNSISVLNEGKTLRGSLIVNIEYGADEKFDINNNKLLIDYLNIILNRQINDDEKNAINIGVNMNLNELSSIKDLKNYIYNDNQIKINNSIISAVSSHPKDKDKDGNETEDITKTITELTIVTDEDNRFNKDSQSDIKDAKSN